MKETPLNQRESTKDSTLWHFNGEQLYAGKIVQLSNPYSLGGCYNTVEGVNAIYRLSYYKRWVKRDTTNKEKRPETRRLEISPLFRYAFARENFPAYYGSITEHGPVVLR